MRVLRARYRSPEEFLRHYQPAFAAGGLFFPTREVLPIGEPVLVEVRFPQLVNKTLLRGQVAWCRPGKHQAKLRAGLGIEFSASEARRRDFLIAAAKGQETSAVQRRHRRLPVRLLASWRRARDREVKKSYIEDISTGGAFVCAGQSLPPGTGVVLSIVPPGSVRPIEIAARVVWSGFGGEESGFGVEFRCRDAGGHRRIKELVRRLEEIEGDDEGRGAGGPGDPQGDGEE